MQIIEALAIIINGCTDKFIGKPADDYGESFDNLQNKNALFEVTTRLLRDDDVNRDWVWEIRESISVKLNER